MGGSELSSDFETVAAELESIELPDVPPVRLPGSEGYWSGWEWGEELEKAFPGQHGMNFASACHYNDYGPTKEHNITYLKMTQEGERDVSAWSWRVSFDNGEVWSATGSCDYTGWDCQSNLDWIKLT